mgnify:CR=1 FL=1
MKNNIILLISTFSFGFAVVTTTQFKIDGMMCGVSCPKAIKNSLHNAEGIKKCDVDFNSKTATITYENEKINKKEIVSIISEKTYFKASEKETKEKNSFWNWLFGKK